MCNTAQDDGSCDPDHKLVFVLSKTGNLGNQDKINEIIHSLCFDVEDFTQVSGRFD